MKNLILLLLLFAVPVFVFSQTRTSQQEKKDKKRLDSLCRKNPSLCADYEMLVGKNSVFYNLEETKLKPKERHCFDKKINYRGLVNNKPVEGCYYVNRLKSLNSFNVNNNQIKVQIWKQKQRLRVYLDGEKIWDLPQAFENGQALNSILFSRYEAKEGNYFYISNLRLASSEDDLRSKILKEGRFSTNAILFATNSSAIKPESSDIISQIAEVLKQESSLKLKIIGHTDYDGKKDANLTLSKQRAESVKNELVKKYGISATRLETDGKGDTEPVSDNSTANGKSQNRRVEFVKMN
ncbi:MAG: OmpA family protein [Bergeyella sp.]